MNPEPLDPRAWVGCTVCFEGPTTSAGTWVAARDAEATSLESLHNRTSPFTDECREEGSRWCYDVEDLPVSREMSPAAATRWAELVDECDEHLRGAFYAWVEDQGLTEPPDDLKSFVESYAGSYDDAEDFARCWAEETDMMDRWPDDAVRYFAWERFARDMVLGGDISLVRDPEGGVWVFWSR